MTMIDQWAALAAAAAAASLALRGELLKPTLGAFASAPAWVFASLICLSIVLAARVISILAGSPANAWEAATYTALALSSAAMLANILRQRRRPGREKVEAGVVTSAMVRRPDLRAASVDRRRL